MKCLHIITPVKDSIDFTLETVRAILASDIKVPFTYTVYNDFSTEENTKRLEEASKELNFRLVNLSDITTHPSPNYLLVLQRSQQEAIADDAGLLIVESDVVVKKNTLQELYDGAAARRGCAIAAAVTVDENGVINYPYLHAKGNEGKVYPEKKHCSFCCSLLTPEFLRAFDFRQLDPTKNWFDVTISHEALKQGFQNYLFTTLPVWHRPHGSRPWKQLKYKNPLKYYWLKYTKGLDKILMIADMDKAPLVSVVVPVYNMEAFLPETLDSILASVYPNFEVVVVDDGSKDASYRIACSYAEKDKRVRAYTQPNGGGLCSPKIRLSGWRKGSLYCLLMPTTR